MGASLIIAIGAQNAYVLVEALRRNHHFLLAGICACLDAALISAGVLGLGTAVAASPVLRLITGLGGAAFLICFGLGSLRAALRADAMALAEDRERPTLKKTVLGLLAVSLLNPHVYLDTVIMLGSISGNYGEARYLFGAGALTASFIWFFSLAFFGAKLAPVFTRPRAWQILYGLVTLMVWGIALRLLWGLFFSF